MAEVTPPGEIHSRWLPFEDEHLLVCHLEYCSGSAGSSARTVTIECPYCGAKSSIQGSMEYNKGNIHTCHSCKETFEVRAFHEVV